MSLRRWGQLGPEKLRGIHHFPPTVDGRPWPSQILGCVLNTCVESGTSGQPDGAAGQPRLKGRPSG